MQMRARKEQMVTSEMGKGNREILNKLLKKATLKVRPSKRMIAFYNAIGKLPLRIGTSLLILTSIDTIKIITHGIRKRTDSAIQVIYQHRFRPWRLFWAIGDCLWQGSYNCRSVRARGKFVQEAVKFLLGNFAQKLTSFDNSNHKLTVVSLGSGSASQLLRGVMDNGLNINNIKVVLVDYDPRALDVGRRNVCQLGLEGVVEFQQMMIGRFLQKEVASMSVNFFEMVGLADYFKNRQLQKYINKIYTALAPEGLFLGSNISSKEEMFYAHNASCWPKMYYRSSTKIKAMLEEAGFEEIWIRTCGLYVVWVAQKFL